VLPLGPERSMAIFECTCQRKSMAAGGESVRGFSDQIQVEDVGICEVVQKNLRSRSYSRGRFSVTQKEACTRSIGCMRNGWK